MERRLSLQFGILLFVAFAVRWTVLGDWTYHTDEQFYFLVGQRMLEGKLLYVDMWDRKGPVLFLIYAACAFISSSVLSYQVAATLSAALGAFLIVRIAARLTQVRYGMLAGIAYFAMLAHFGGGGGQSPVFYNTFMLIAALTIVRSIDRLASGKVPLQLYAGVACAGLAIATKATAGIEGIFFGVFILVTLWRSPASRARIAGHAVALALVALLPLLMTLLYYELIGHFHAVWNALVTSNFQRGYETAYGRTWRSGVMLGRLGLMLVFAAIGWHLSVQAKGRSGVLIFLGLWPLVAVGAVLVFPNLFLHYILPITAPLCILASRYFARGAVGVIGLVIVLVYNFAVGGTFDLPYRKAAHLNGEALAEYVRSVTPDRKLFVYSSAGYLYSLANAPLPSRIVFADHFFNEAESGVTGMDERKELRRVLDQRPETVVFETDITVRSTPNIVDNIAVYRYLKRCRHERSFVLFTSEGPAEQQVYSDCGH